ncbi:MAG: PD40 domain-containing protein [Ignavibacteriae bacterium]|nr:PD40 domain-containing protein [Ignavibacteriota bacterium]
MKCGCTGTWAGSATAVTGGLLPVSRLLTPIFVILALLAPTVAQGQPDEYSAPEKDWFTIEAKHFRVVYHEGSERTARAAAKVADEIYGPITSLYGHEPDERVSLIIKDISDYSNGAAYFFNNKIEIWASPLDFELRGTHNWLRNVLAHEFTHIVQMQAAMKWGRRLPALTLQWFGYEKERRSDVLYGYPNVLISYPLPGIIVPPWMAEGTAQYMRHQFGYEHWDSHRDMILRSYVLSDSMLSWPEMGAFGKTSLGNESVYNAGYNLTRYIARKYGEKAVVDITRAMGKTFVFTIDAAIKKAIGIDGADLYREWATDLRADYARRIAPVLARRAEGEIIAATGFGNFHPAYSPDGKKIAYVSNKTSDYFGQSAVYLYDVEKGSEELLVAGVRSALTWSPDGARIVYSKYNPPSVYGHLYYDVYEYTLATKEEKRITEGKRAFNPALSPDGTRLAYVAAKDGSVNLWIADADGGNARQATTFTDGEQVFTPAWAPDGSHLVFGYSARAQRGVARVNSDGSGFALLVDGGESDARDPKYSADGRHLIYASDRTGIFNIYRRELASGRDEQLTNVVGGAFMPAVDARGNVAYAAYTASGYKLALLRVPAPLALASNDYIAAGEFAPAIASADQDAWEWNRLSAYNDRGLPAPAAKPYKTIFQSMMLFPVLRFDTYNPDNTGLALLKPGLMFYSSDILGRLEMLGSGAINIKGERDLFASFTYKDRLPLLASLGVFPAVSLDVVNVTRKTSSSIQLPIDTVGVDVSFNLLEFGVRVQHNLFSSHTQLDLGYRHSRYTSTVGSFRNPDTDGLVPARDNLYLIGNDLSAAVRHHAMEPTRDGEINPVGLRLGLYYDFEFNRFNPNGDFDYDASTGMIVPRYTNFDFHRLETVLSLAARLPGWQHTLAVRLRAGSILGAPVDDFFNFYAGGITGMQGYSYYALGGNEVYHANVTYRFPIIASMDFRLGHLLFDKLYGGLFFDAGDAVADPSQFTAGTMKTDAGFELRLETYSFSMYPTRIFFSGAYGLTDFTRTFNFRDVRYGREWRWYVGVLFGFDLSDK